jgi:hypothetical protein
MKKAFNSKPRLTSLYPSMPCPSAHLKPTFELLLGSVLLQSSLLGNLYGLHANKYQQSRYNHKTLFRYFKI